jgi:hypothetical protein
MANGVYKITEDFEKINDVTKNTYDFDEIREIFKRKSYIDYYK